MDNGFLLLLAIPLIAMLFGVAAYLALVLVQGLFDGLD